MSLGSGIRKKPIPDPGSRGQKGTGSRIPDPGSGSATLLFPKTNLLKLLVQDTLRQRPALRGRSPSEDRLHQAAPRVRGI